MSNQNALVKNSSGLKRLCEAMAPKIAEVLPRHLTPERIAKTALLAASRNPQLYNCTEGSLARSIMTASELGLDCSGTLGSAYLVPYGRDANLIIGYRGLIDLARRSGKIRAIEARVVHENDVFDVDYGNAANPITHKPCLTGDPGGMLFVYARAWLTDQENPQVEVMRKDEVDAIRGRSKAGQAGPWKTDYEEMARKTVVRRLCKYLPLSVEVERAFQAEDEAERSVTTTARVVERADAAAFLDETSGSLPDPEPEDAEFAAQEPADGENATEPDPTPAEKEKTLSASISAKQRAMLRVLLPVAESYGWDEKKLKSQIKQKGAAVVALELNMDREEFDVALAEALEKEESE